MLYLDLAMRSGAATVLILLAVLLWRAPIGLEGRLSIIAVAISQTAHLVMDSPMPLDLPPALSSGLILLACLTPNAVTWLIVTIFLDWPRRRWPWLVASSVVSGLYYAQKVAPELGLPSCLIAATGLYGGLLVLALWTSRDDMVECRCRARPGFAIAISGLSLGLSSAEVLGLQDAGSVELAILHSSSILAVSLAFAVWILRPDMQVWPGPADAPTPQPDVKDDTLDIAVIAQIKNSMAHGIWREEGLTISALAHQLSVPEHRLRRAINQGLGYRNFSSFINHARIDAAKQQLENPKSMGKTVLEIAYDVGFASLGPFNRAFRAITGQSPTEFRRDALGQTSADSFKSAPI
ncbi:MAG: helix-turn-helix domain-containing protein [Sulfitobacter sp.]